MTLTAMPISSLTMPAADAMVTMSDGRPLRKKHP
jgi:hypothetical protein